MSDEGFADRLNADMYQDDPMIGVFDYDYLVPAKAFVPERLWKRLHLLGAAYELHYIGLLDAPKPMFLNSVQAHHLVDELVFVRGIVDDPLLAQYLDQLLPVVAAAARSASKPALRIEGG